MKKFFVLLIGIIGGFVIGFMSYGKARGVVHNVYAYVQEKCAEFMITKHNADEDEIEETLVAEDATPITEEVEFVEEEVLIEPEMVEASTDEQQKAEAANEATEVTETKEPDVVMIDTVHGKQGVAATINGKPITVDEIRFTYDVNPQIKDKVSFEQFYDKAVRVYVEGKMLYNAAVANKILETEDYKKQLALLEQDIARKVFLEKTLEKSVNEESMRKLYNDYRKSFKPQKEVKAKHILVENESLANEVISKLGEGQKFDTLAEQYSKEPAELGYFTKDMMVEEFGNAAFALGAGEYSKEPVKTEYGYHVILVEDIRDSKPAEYNEAAPQLKQMMTSKVMENLYRDVKKNLDVVVYDLNGKQIPLEEPQE